MTGNYSFKHNLNTVVYHNGLQIKPHAMYSFHDLQIRRLLGLRQRFSHWQQGEIHRFISRSMTTDYCVRRVCPLLINQNRQYLGLFLLNTSLPTFKSYTNNIQTNKSSCHVGGLVSVDIHDILFLFFKSRQGHNIQTTFNLRTLSDNMSCHTRQQSVEFILSFSLQVTTMHFKLY